MMNVPTRASIHPSRPQAICVASPSSSFCRCVIDDESLVGIKRSVRGLLFFFLFSELSVLWCSHVHWSGSQSCGFDFGRVLSLKLCFLVWVAQCELLVLEFCILNFDLRCTGTEFRMDYYCLLNL